MRGKRGLKEEQVMKTIMKKKDTIIFLFFRESYI